MDDVRVAGPARANFRAGRLVSYAFSVEATIGQKPMRYLFARRFSGPPGRGSAATAIFVLKPEVLFGTYVWIDEDLALATCSVQTYLPTMREPLQVVDRLVFDCLPLTEIGYVDLMAWPHPALQPVAPGLCADRLPDLLPGAETRCFSGPSSMPGLRVSEVVGARHGMVLARTVHDGAQQVRRWELIEQGGAEEDRLPRRIRVSRSQGGHRSDFVRTSPATAIPAADFDLSPPLLREAVARRLREERE